MSAHTELDLTVIESLDFQPPCEVQVARPDWEPCGADAAWFITYTHHCIPGAQKSRFVCDPCLGDYMAPHRLSVCSTCGELGHVGPRIVRTERIGS